MKLSFPWLNDSNKKVSEILLGLSSQILSRKLANTRNGILHFLRHTQKYTNTNYDLRESVGCSYNFRESVVQSTKKLMLTLVGGAGETFSSINKEKSLQPTSLLTYRVRNLSPTAGIPFFLENGVLCRKPPSQNMLTLFVLGD